MPTGVSISCWTDETPNLGSTKDSLAEPTLSADSDLTLASPSSSSSAAGTSFNSSLISAGSV